VKISGNKGHAAKRDIEGPEFAVPAGVPKPPKTMGKEGAAFWRQLAPKLHQIGLLTEVDLPLFEQLCGSWDLLQEANRNIREGKLTTTAKSGYEQVSPWFTIRRETLKQMIQIGARFGLSPSDRTGLDVPKLKTDPGEEWFG
jgi:P27 family predicted phage terminase small subunit